MDEAEGLAKNEQDEPTTGYLVPASVLEQLAYENSDNVKQTMIRLVAARAYINSLSSDEDKKAAAPQLMTKVFDGATTESRALELLATQKGTVANKARLEDLGLTSKQMPKNALVNLSKADRFVGKKELHTFLCQFIELAKPAL